MFTDSIGSQSSPLSISVSGRGNDIFLHWMSNCKGHDKETLKYSFAEGENIHDMVRKIKLTFDYFQNNPILNMVKKSIPKCMYLLFFL